MQHVSKCRTILYDNSQHDATHRQRAQVGRHLQFPMLKMHYFRLVLLPGKGLMNPPLSIYQSGCLNTAGRDLTANSIPQNREC